MASEPSVGGEDGAREIRRYSENKVYKRKVINGPRKDALSSTTTTLTAEDSPASKPSKANENNVDNENNNSSSLKGVYSRNLASDGADSAPQLPNRRMDVNLTQQPSGEGNLTQQPVVSQPEDANSAQPQEANSMLHLSIPQPEAAPDDCSLSLRRAAVLAIRDPPLGNGLEEKAGLDGKFRIDLASQSKQEMRELRKRLQGELDTVRTWVKRIEAKEGQIGGFSHSRIIENGAVVNGAPRIHLDLVPVSAPPHHRENRILNQLSISVLENSQGITESVEKEKRTPKANQFYRNSEFLLAKDKFPPADSNRKSKANGKKKGGDPRGRPWMGTKFFKNCSSLLEKLMKHQYGWVFNSPVDVEGLGLHDYYSIIKHPMDLATVKKRLNANIYRNPKEFAEDVRLTFHNSMTYNPEGQDAHIMAATLLKLFEDRWAIIEADYYREMRIGFDYEMELPTPISRKAPPLLPAPLGVRRVLDRSESRMYTSDFRPISVTPSGRAPAPRKPKAKDPHKREMTFDEKQKLSTNLQNLPLEKLDNIVQIIRKRNSALCQHDDEIEVDIDSVDAETLWELDRFVTNYKKSLSKYKRKAELAMQARLQEQQNVPDKDMVPLVMEMPKETDEGQKIVSSSSPLQMENQGPNSSGSSSSSSSSSDSGSSSSDSDTDSSSGSDSDVEHSPRT